MTPQNLLYTYDCNYINSLVFKLTDYCNQGCNYCYRENNTIRSERVMSDEIIFKTMENYLHYLKTQKSLRNQAYMIWHGGEPLLAGKNKFKTIIEYQKQLSEKNEIEFINAVQTNGTIIDEEWASFFEQNNFFSGI